MLSVRSCCSSSTTHRRTLPDHVGYFSVTFSDGGEMEARWRRDGGETEASWRRAEGELEARRRRRRDGRRRRGGGEMADGGERRRRNGGEKAAAAATRLATTRVARTAMCWRSRRPPSHLAGRSTGSRARWRQQARRERRLAQVTEGVARAAREAEPPRRARHALPCRLVASRRLGASIGRRCRLSSASRGDRQVLEVAESRTTDL